LQGWGFDAYSVIATREDKADGPPAIR